MPKIAEPTPEKYPNLFAYLKANNLKIRSNFGATDMDCALCIVHNDHSSSRGMYDHIKKPYYLSFLYAAYEGLKFNTGDDLKHSIGEKEFLEVLSQIVESHQEKFNTPKKILREVLSGRYDLKDYKALIESMSEEGVLLLGMVAKIANNKTCTYASGAIQSKAISEKAAWAVAYQIRDNISKYNKSLEL